MNAQEEQRLEQLMNEKGPVTEEYATLMNKMSANLLQSMFPTRVSPATAGRRRKTRKNRAGKA